MTSVPVTTNRRFQDVWLMVPGVYVRPDTQEATGSERRTSVDGMDVTDPFGGDIFAVNLNYEAIQDVEIKALGAEASDGASMVGCLPIGPSLAKGQTMAASAPDVASHNPSCDHENERTLPG